MKTYLNPKLLMLASTLFLASNLIAADSDSTTKNVDVSRSREEALRKTETGDQTDVYAIPLDNDNLYQEEELDEFEAESKAYEKKEKEKKDNSTKRSSKKKKVLRKASKGESNTAS